jgi:energy-coupling factor transporter ATP-binding protein EcfA2
MMQTNCGYDPIIQACNVSYRYADATVPVLDHVNLTIHRGDFTAFIGQNGAGKTTLAKTFNGLLQPASGELLVSGHSTRGSEPSQLARLVGYVYQNPDHQIFA